MRCLDLSDGSLVWKGGNFGPDGSCIPTADDYVVAYGNRRLVVVEAADRSPESYHEVASRSGICAKNAAWPRVVLSGSRIYCKDRQGNLTCFDLAADQQK